MSKIFMRYIYFLINNEMNNENKNEHIRILLVDDEPDILEIVRV